MTSDLWYVGNVLANDPKRERMVEEDKTWLREKAIVGWKMSGFPYISSVSLFLTSKTLKKIESKFLTCTIEN